MDELLDDEVEGGWSSMLNVLFVSMLLFPEEGFCWLSSDLTNSHVLPLSQNDKYSMMTCRCVTGSYENFDDATVK